MSQRSELAQIAIEKSRLLDRDKALREELQAEVNQFLAYAGLAVRAIDIVGNLLRPPRRRKPAPRRSFFSRVFGDNRERVPVR